MPYDPASMSTAEWIGTAIGVLSFLAAQWWTIFKLLSAKFGELSDALAERTRERVEAMEKARIANDVRFTTIDHELTRLDRDQVATRTRLDSLPTKEQLEALLDRRFDKQDAKIDKLHDAFLRMLGRERNDGQPNSRD